MGRVSPVFGFVVAGRQRVIAESSRRQATAALLDALLIRTAPASVVEAGRPASSLILGWVVRARAAAAALVAVTAAWGSTFVLIKDLVERMPVMDFLAVRFLVAAAALAALNPRSLPRLRRLTPAQLRQGVVLGLLYGVAQIGQTAGLQHTDAAVSGFVTGMYVVFTPLACCLLLRRPVSPLAWSAVAVSTAGLALLSLRGFSLGYGEALTLASAGLYALHIVGLGSWSNSREAYGLALVQTATIAAVCAGTSAGTSWPNGITLPSDRGSWLGVLYTALVAGALALLVQTWAQAQLAPTRAAVIMTTEPVFAAVFAVAVGGESLTWRMLAGGGLIVAAMYLAELGPRWAPKWSNGLVWER
jgi:drug/metabolite transporter (DMT)-like permease